MLELFAGTGGLELLYVGTGTGGLELLYAGIVCWNWKVGTVVACGAGLLAAGCRLPACLLQTFTCNICCLFGLGLLFG